MRSIRLSLLVYFLVLLALALGAVSTIVYQTSHESLLAKKTSGAERLSERFHNRSRDERDRLDKALERQVQYLATVVQNPGAHHQYRELALLGILSAGLSPQWQVQVPAWLAEVTPGPLFFDILRRNSSITMKLDRDALSTGFPLGILSSGGAPSSLFLAHLWTSPRLRWELEHIVQPTSIRITFSPDILPGNRGGQDRPYCQVAGGPDDVWQRSLSLDDHTLDLPQTLTAKLGLSEWAYREMKLEPGVNVRIVTLKSPMPGFLPSFWWRAPRGRGPGGRFSFTRAAGTHGPRPSSYFFIQYARDTGPRDAAIAGFRAERDKDVAALQEELETSEAALRGHLLRISLITFAATIIGGFWLVRLGLSPLQRLSEAVSKVSVRDFRLPLDEARMPGELRPIVARLTQTLDLLKRAFAREKQAAADISHELRTPLSALLTTIEVALRKPRSPDEYRELLGDCQASGKQMSQLVERLLALARLDAGVDNLRPREVDVADLAEQCVALVRPLAEARGLRLRVHGDGPAPMTADPDKLREVLTNLLHNAIEYNRPDGSIDLVVERDNGDLRVDVRDTGIGIPAAARDHIFERFYRADPSRQADGLHAGLGLAIVKGYIDLMGGTIGVESTEGEGSTFRVRLPVSGRAPTVFIDERVPAPSKN